MPYAVNQAVRTYYEVEGEGPPLVLLHGLTYTLEGWRTFGYTEALKHDYQLILIDIRGSGASDTFDDPEDYGMEPVIADILGVLEDIQVEQAHFWGWSLGAEIAFRIAQFAPERVLSMVTGGSHPFERDGNPPGFFVEALGAGVDRWVADWEMFLGEVPEAHVQQLNRGDPKAFVAWMYAKWPSAESALPVMTMPVLAYAGELDDYAFPLTQKYAKLLPNATLLTIPGLDHFTGFAHSEQVLPPVTQFLSTLNSA